MKMKKMSSNQQLSLTLEFCDSNSVVESKPKNSTELDNVVVMEDFLEKKAANEMAVFKQRVLKNVEAYFNL